MCNTVKTPKAYGTWDSLIGIKQAVATFTSFTDVVVDPKTQSIYYLEELSDGRSDVVLYAEKGPKPLLPKPRSARNFVQEYGGATAIVYNDVVYFSNDDGKGPKNVNNRIYSLHVSDPSQTVKPITPETQGLMRYANFAIHPKHENLLVTLREDHTKENDGDAYDPTKIVNTVCVVDTALDGSEPHIIIEGAGFYASPVFNTSGTKVAWQEWDLGDMPWQGGTIYVADVEVKSGVLTVSKKSYVKVAGNKGTQCATYPRWISDTKLLYTVDTPTENPPNHFQNPFIFDTTKQNHTPVLKTPLSRDFSEPAWYLGQDPYAILNQGEYAVFTAFRDGRNIVYVLDLIKPSDPVEIKGFDFVVAQHIRPLAPSLGKNSFVFTGSKSSDPAVFTQSSDAGGVIKGTVSVKNGSYTVDFAVLMSSGNVSGDLKQYLSEPVPKNLYESDPTKALYIVLYKPVNPNYTGLIGEKPPCIVNVHGGPTALEPQSLNWIKMFYTSRGYAWLDVNYRGASSYGRNYMDSLYGKWGEYDIEDCYDAARILADKAEIDGKRVAIRGGSAGGYATLSSITFAKDPIPTFYKTACSAYGGVTNPALLAEATEKFECKYLDILFGTPDRSKWESKSPVKNITDPVSGKPNLTTPLLMLHGEDDNVVPPDQARQFLQKVNQLLPSEKIELIFFPGEGHHWLHDKTKQTALEKESDWYENNLL